MIPTRRKLFQLLAGAAAGFACRRGQSPWLAGRKVYEVARAKRPQQILSQVIQAQLDYPGRAETGCLPTIYLHPDDYSELLRSVSLEQRYTMDDCLRPNVCINGAPVCGSWCTHRGKMLVHGAPFSYGNLSYSVVDLV